MMISCTRLYVGSHRGDGTRKEMEAYNPYKTGMIEHAGTEFIS